jgi:hypothetical protein
MPFFWNESRIAGWVSHRVFRPLCVRRSGRGWQRGHGRRRGLTGGAGTTRGAGAAGPTLTTGPTGTALAPRRVMPRSAVPRAKLTHPLLVVHHAHLVVAATARVMVVATAALVPKRESGEEDHRFDEYDTGNDGDPQCDDGEPARPVWVRFVSRRRGRSWRCRRSGDGCWFGLGFWCFAHAAIMPSRSRLEALGPQ